MKFKLMVHFCAHIHMEKEDVSYQTLEQLHERRKQVAKWRGCINGIKVMQIVKMVELSYPTIRPVIDLFVDGGWPLRLAPNYEVMNQGKELTAENQVLYSALIFT
jgi:hypothetical protein